MNLKDIINLVTNIKIIADVSSIVYATTSKSIIYSNTTDTLSVQVNYYENSNNFLRKDISSIIFNDTYSVRIFANSFIIYLFLNEQLTKETAQLKLLTTAKIIYSILFGKKAPSISNVSFIDYESKDDLSFSNRKINEIQHNSYLLEKQLINAITQGNTKIFQQVNTEFFSSGNIGKMNLNERKSSFNQAIACLTLFTRAAIEGGVDPEKAFSISDQIAQKLDQNSKIQIQSFSTQIGNIFIKEVQKHQSYNKSPLINKIESYIVENVYSSLDLNTLASKLNYSHNYISTYYKKETGQTLSSFIMKNKLREAKNLLMYTNKSINSIAFELSFKEVSHFSNVFKKYEGISPSEYRRKKQI
ncbi:helix-turn-helix domain-containing protein [Ligilactobacillus agilis]|uniref:AraC family transcriptional regulator n=1 Tax=Ligilactobacillus agilis TaxID=1601 RepID=UPI003F8CB8ED